MKLVAKMHTSCSIGMLIANTNFLRFDMWNPYKTFQFNDPLSMIDIRFTEYQSWVTILSFFLKL